MQSHEFRDFDEFADSVRGVDCRMMRHNPKNHVWSIADVDLGGPKVQFGQLGSGNIVEGQSAGGAVILYMPLTETCEYTFNGLTVKKDEFAILEPDSDVAFSTKIEHDFCMAVFPVGHFADLQESERPTLRVIRDNPERARKFRQIVRQILDAASACSDFESTLAAKYASAALVELASMVVAHEPATELFKTGRPRIPRKEIIDRTMALLETRELEPVNIRELATAVGVSERTLRRVFIEYFGIGPSRYLQLKRLHLINRVLRAADPELDSVTSILAQHGEWEFGRVAARYHRLFGELPSVTLQASR